MHPRLHGRFSALEERKQRLLAEIEQYTPEQQLFRPGPDTWSIRQVAQHLLLVEQGVLRAVSDPQWQSPGRRTVRHGVGALLVRIVFALGIRVKVPVRGVQPREDLSLEDLKQRWQKARSEMGRYLEGVDAARLEQPLLRHPIAGPLNLPQGLDFLTQHFDHHLRQIRRIRRAAGFPA